MSKDKSYFMIKRIKRKKQVVESFCLTFSSREKNSSALRSRHILLRLTL